MYRCGLNRFKPVLGDILQNVGATGGTQKLNVHRLNIIKQDVLHERYYSADKFSRRHRSCQNSRLPVLSDQNRCCSSHQQSNLVCTPLENRTLIRAAGKDATDFLQGLITNDMRLLDPSDSSLISDEEDVTNPALSAMYAMMLNIQGRVLYDIIVYRVTDELPHYLLECEKGVATDFLKLMKRYKLRKKVDLALPEDLYAVWSVTPSDDMAESPQQLDILDSSAVVLAPNDPRIPTFGHRLLLKSGTTGSDVVSEASDAKNSENYHKRRYAWGLSEGTVDLPPGNSLPLESNAVFLNGVSFSKGCYIGQELTARTHHTGVIRKRLMPVQMLDGPSDAQPGCKIENQAGKNCGKFRNAVGTQGIALLRIGDVIGKGPLVMKNENNDIVGNIEAAIPPWWPVDSDIIIKEALAAQT